MMAERRLVVLKEAQDFKGMEDLLPYFEQPSDQTIFVINYKYKNYDSRKKTIKAASKHGSGKGHPVWRGATVER